MKRYFLVFIVCITSCSTSQYPPFSYNKSRNPWIDAFKDQVFFSSLKESYKGDTIMNLIGKKDAFNPYDGLSLNAVNKAKQLGVQLVKNMPSPSMCDGCNEGQNYYMANALHYYSSRELDSIARFEFKKHRKHDKKVWEITP